MLLQDVTNGKGSLKPKMSPLDVDLRNPSPGGLKPFRDQQS
jgi:hypothetical protein